MKGVHAILFLQYGSLLVFQDNSALNATIAGFFQLNLVSSTPKNIFLFCSIVHIFYYSFHLHELAKESLCQAAKQRKIFAYHWIVSSNNVNQWLLSFSVFVSSQGSEAQHILDHIKTEHCELRWMSNYLETSYEGEQPPLKYQCCL